MQRTPKFLLIEERLGRDLADHLTERRLEGVSYERIAREIFSLTDVEITTQSIQTWCSQLAVPSDGAGAA